MSALPTPGVRWEDLPSVAVDTSPLFFGATLTVPGTALAPSNTVARPRRRPDAQITAMQGHRSTGDAEGVWLQLPTGLVWMAPDAAESLAGCLTRAAADCKAARLATPTEEPPQ